MTVPAASVSGLARYPVKSMQGAPCDRLDIGPEGVVGDREWALIDGRTGHLMSAKRFSALLTWSADDDGITLPDGATVGFGDSDADAILSECLGRPVELQ